MAARRKNQNRQAIDGRSKVLRALPSIDECFRAALRDPALNGFAHDYLRLLLRRAQAALRTSLASAEIGTAPTDSGAEPSIAAADNYAAPGREALVDEIVRIASAAAAADEPSLRTV